MSPRLVTTAEDAYYRVRVVLPGALLYLASRTEPIVKWAGTDLATVEAEWITDDPDAGDTLGFVHWPAVVAITWRSTAPTTELEP